MKQTPKEKGEEEKKEEEDDTNQLPSIIDKPIYVSLQGMGRPRVKGYPCCKAEGLNGVLFASR